MRLKRKEGMRGGKTYLSGDTLSKVTGAGRSMDLLEREGDTICLFSKGRRNLGITEDKDIW